MKANWFIGIPVPPAGWFDAIPDVAPGCRRFAAGDLHLTVAFLGGVDASAARAAWRAIAWSDGPAAVTLGAVVPMGSPRRYSALSVILADGREAIETGIARERGAAYEAAGVPPDDRPARAHITIARPTRKATHDERKNALDWAASIALPVAPVRLAAIALYTWSDDRASALFRIVEETSLPKRG
jgi:RNA 2',3'-cyclic 3'-phosphodiesterase